LRPIGTRGYPQARKTVNLGSTVATGDCFVAAPHFPPRFSSAIGEPLELTCGFRDTEMTINALMICGSLRKGSFNRALMNALPPLAPAGMALTEAPSFRGFPLYDADLQASGGFPADVVGLADAIRAADGVIIISPEYNWTIPGALKNAFDWVSRLAEQPFKNKPVAIQSATGGPLGGARMQYHLRMALTYLNAHVFGTPEVFVGVAQTKFDEKTLALRDEPTRKIIAQQLDAFGSFIARMKG
jgi:chromate reductase, NAD(P)H dehydrogenase (quinone)